MERIGRREFLLHPYKYLKNGSFIITNRGKDQLIINIESTDSGELKVVTKEINDLVNVKYKLDKIMVNNYEQWNSKKEIKNEYGCGCDKVDKKILCPKHARY